LPSPFLLLGIGNADRGDDGVGPVLAKKLADDPVLRQAGVEVLPHSGEGASLMDLWEGTDLTVVVDAMKSGAAVGHLRRIDATGEKLATGVFHYSSHLFSLAEAVEMSRQLGRLPKSLVVYGIEGADFTFGAPLSPEVETALADVEERVRGEFARVRTIGATGTQ
jgi:hydrogenase maturation protease